MFGNNFWIIVLGMLVLDVVIVVLVTYFLFQSRIKRFHQEQQLKADSVLTKASEAAKSIELEARDKALKIMQEGEADVTRRRADLAREEDRLQKRRVEIDARMERIELRDQTLNKRQSAIDKRTNELEKLYAQQLEEVQRVAEMSVEEARAQLLADAEKEARNDMARIIRQIEV